MMNPQHVSKIEDRYFIQQTSVQQFKPGWRRQSVGDFLDPMKLRSPKAMQDSGELCDS